MAEWTRSAKEKLKNYLGRLQKNLASSKVDTSEVIENIKQHIDEEIKSLDIKVVTGDEIEQILSRMGSPGSEAEGMPKVSASTSPSVSKTRIHSTRKVLVFLFGVILPAVALIVEWQTHMCASTFFDPIPTVWHALLIAFVPLANLLVLVTYQKMKTAHLSKVGFANGIALGVSFFYTILFLPILPILVMLVIYLGFGLLGLAPLFSFRSAIACRIYLKEIAASVNQKKVAGMWKGVALALGLLILFEMPSTLTRFGMEWAASDSERVKTRAIKMLRSVGSKDVMLRMCYERAVRFTDMIGFLFTLGNPVRPSEAREIYYRVTGVPFNSVSPPRLSGRGRYNPRLDFDFDLAQGGEAVGGVLRGLSLSSSRMDSSLDPNAALGYLEWTLVFKNTSARQREARTQIMLPPGGAVSRLTLWINGEEREAAFAGRRKVQEAYQQVVRRRRDPVLVTTSGPDRILVQCFPVPAEGEMKVRIGITAPLLLETKEKATLLLPCFLERNFSIPERVKHSIWVEAKSPIKAMNKNLVGEHPKDELYAVRGMVPDSEMSAGRLAVYAERSFDKVLAWTDDPVKGNHYVIQQIIEETETFSPSCVVFVIDGSQDMLNNIPAIAETFASLPEGIEFGLIVASDTVRELVSPTVKGIDEVYRKAEMQLNKLNYVGGQDNVPALARAWDIAAQKPGGVIIWIHGVQPVVLENVDVLRQKWERRQESVGLFELQVRNGPNRILEGLDGIQNIATVPHFTELTGDLKRLFLIWEGKIKKVRFSRKRIEHDKAADLSDASKTSSHLTRLWARDEILKLYYSGKKGSVDEAINIAASYQLVTPVSGAVVLETEAQYKQAGLEPADSATVPTIPEPKTIILLAVVAIVLAWVFYQRRYRWKEV